MSTELQYAGEYEVQRLEIQSSTADSVDLRKTYVEINLFEGIFSNALSGSIILADTNDIVTSLPIIGQEFVNMKPRMAGKSSFNFINSFLYMFRNLLALITSFSFK